MLIIGHVQKDKNPSDKIANFHVNKNIATWYQLFYNNK